MRAESEKKVIYDVVKAHLMGTPVKLTAHQLVAGQQLQQQQQQHPLLQPPQQAALGAASVLPSARGVAQAPGDTSSLLRSLSSRWKFGVS